MKISPVPSIANTAPTPIEGGQSQVQAYRSLKMNVNRTPLTQASVQQALPIPNMNNDIPGAAEVTQPLSPQLAFLAKQKRSLQVKEREIAEREKALLERSSSSQIDVAKLKSDPLSVLLENGVTYDQLTESLMQNHGNNEINDLKAEIQSLKQGIDQKFLDKDAAAEKQVLAEMQREAQMLVRGSEDFELVRETRSVPTVMKLIENTYRESGEVLEVNEALRLVEEELFKDAQRLAAIKKVQNGINPLIPQVQPQLRTPGMRTLTNRDTASVPLSAKARAMAAFYGTLKR